MRMNRLNLDLSSTVWFSTLPPGINKLVLLAYCLHVNDHTGLCWPSVGRIAALTGMSPRTVQRHVRALEAAGILKARPTTNATRVYQLALDGLPLCPALMKPVADVQGDSFNAAPVDNLAQGGDSFDTDPRQSVQQGVAICTETPDRMSPKQVLTDRTDEGTERTAQEPATTPASPASRSSAVPPVLLTQTPAAESQTLARFAALHQRKGYGPVTDATLDTLKAEGERAGLTLPQVVTHCVERRWGTFRAAWLTPKPPHRHGSTLAPHSAHPAPAMPGDGGWGLASDARASGSTPQRLSPDGELAARKLAAFEASRNAPPATPEQVATHRAKLAALRASYVAGGASAARVAMH